MAGCEQPPVDVAVPDLTKADPLVEAAVVRAADHVAASGGGPEAWAEYGRVLYGNGFNEDALQAFSNSIAVDPAQPRVVYVRSLVHRANFDREAALADAVRAIELAGPELTADQVHLLWRAAWMAMEAAEFERAAAMLDRAAATAPGDVNTQRVRARLHLELGQAEEGLAALAPLIRADPGNSDLKWLQSRLLRAAGRAEEAQTAATGSSERTPVYTDPWAVWAMGRKTGIGVERDRALRLAGAGRHHEARRILQTLKDVEADPRTVGFLEARLRLARGERGSAAAALTRLVEEYPDWAPPHHELGRVMLARPAGGGRPPDVDVDRAVTLLERSVELDPSSAIARFTLAQAYAARRRFGEAVSELQACIELVPANRAWHSALAASQLSGGDPEAALRTIDLAEGIFGGDEPVQALVVRVRASSRLGDKIAAADALARLQVAAPNHPALPVLQRLVQKP
jgi:tetratricopeptide (TPR) repeat protein